MHGPHTIFLSVLFVFLWSSGWVGSKFGLGYSGPFTFLAIRYLIVVLLLSLVIAFISNTQQLSRISSKELLCHALVGLLSHGVYLAGSIASMNWGVSAGMVAFVASMQPLVTTVCSSWILSESSERTNSRQWMGLGVGALAVYVSTMSGLSVGASGLAYLLLFMSVIAISVAILIDRRITIKRQKQKLQPSRLIQILWIHSLSALLFFACFAWLLEGFKASWSMEYGLTLVYMAVIVSIASYGLMYLLLRQTTAVKVSSLVYLTPPATMLLAWPVLGESVTAGGVIGLAIGALAVILVMLNERSIDSSELQKLLLKKNHRKFLKRTYGKQKYQRFSHAN